MTLPSVPAAANSMDGKSLDDRTKSYGLKHAPQAEARIGEIASRFGGRLRYLLVKVYVTILLKCPQLLLEFVRCGRVVRGYN